MNLSRPHGEDHSVVGGAIPKISKQSDLSTGGFNSKRNVEFKIKDFKTDVETKNDRGRRFTAKPACYGVYVRYSAR